MPRRFCTFIGCAILFVSLTGTFNAAAKVKTPSETPDLIDALVRERIPNKQEALAQKISQVATPADLKRLEGLLKNKNKYTRQFAAIALHRKEPKKAIDALLQELQVSFSDENERSSWQFQICKALEKHNDPLALPGLLDILAQGERSEADYVSTTLKAIGASSQKARLVELSKSDKIWTMFHASVLLADIDRPASIAGLKAAWAKRASLETTDNPFSYTYEAIIASGIARLGAPELISEYRMMLKSKKTVDAGIIGLATAKDKTSLEDILTLVLKDDDEGSIAATGLMALSYVGDAKILEKARKTLADNPMDPEKIVRIGEQMQYGAFKNEAQRTSWLELLRKAAKMTAVAEAIVEIKRECEYWAGEDANGDRHRQKQISAGMKAACDDALKKATALLKKNRHDQAARRAAKELLDSVSGPRRDVRALEAILAEPLA